MQLNYMGTVYAIKAVYGSMIQRNQGHICIISSTMGLLGEHAAEIFDACNLAHITTCVFSSPADLEPASPTAMACTSM